MAKATSSRKRMKPKDSKRRGKKKVSPLAIEHADYLDYKDTDLLKRFLSDRAKIRGRRVSGNDTQQQRVVARAIKNAREMGLLPYTSRVTTQRRGRPGGREDRGPREDREERGDKFEDSENVEDVENVDFVAADGEATASDVPVEATTGSEA